MRVLVRDVMSRGVLKLRKEQTINEVARLFLERIIDGAPVVDDEGKVIGVFTKTHLLRAMGKPPDMPIERLMNRNVISIGETMPVEEAMNIPVGRLPVVNSDGKMVGWLTRTDLASAYLAHYKSSIEGLSQIINSTVRGIIAINVQGKITVFNKTAERLWGIEAEKIKGMAVKDVFPVMKMDNILKTGDSVSYQLQVDDAFFNIEMNPIEVNGEIKGVVAEFYKSPEE
ncbi:MAG: CBS domain-containing protein [Eubacteriales bacterium]